MRIRDVSIVLCAIGLASLSAFEVAAQESPHALHPDAETMASDYLIGDNPLGAAASGGACPDTHPWYRSMVDRLAAAELTDHQAGEVAGSWLRIIPCGDATVNAWFGQAFGYTTSPTTAGWVTEGLLLSGLPQHRDVLEAIAFNPETPMEVRYGIYRGVQSTGDTSLQAEFLLGAVETGSFPDLDLLRNQTLWLVNLEENEEFIRSAAQLIQRRPGIQHAEWLLSDIAMVAAAPGSGPFGVSRIAAQDVLDAIESFKSAQPNSPMSVESRDLLMPGILEGEANLRARLGAG